MELNKLNAPFPVDKIHWRVGVTNKKKVNPPTKGIALAYIDARDVMERLDEVVGIGNWQARYTHVGSHGVVCEIGIRTYPQGKLLEYDPTQPIPQIPNEWVWKANGAGDTAVEATKGAMSDAFKRAGVLWGIGRYLYDVENTWVNIDQWGNIDESDIEKLNRTLTNAEPEPTPKAKAEAFVKGAQMDSEEWLIKNQKHIERLRKAYPDLYKELVGE